MQSKTRYGRKTRESATAAGDVFDRKPPEIETGDRTITVLSVSPIQHDHDSLDRLLCRPKWKIHKALSLSSAVLLLQQETRIPLVVCERDLQPGTWKEMLDHLMVLPRPPYLIVTSRLADDYLWAEALNIGAYDVLAKPFDHMGLNRVLTLAWLRWHDQHETAIQSPTTARAPTRQIDGSPIGSDQRARFGAEPELKTRTGSFPTGHS
jgi:DNA-binding NtrC family response regulator